MEKLIDGFTQQINEGIALGESIQLSKQKNAIQNIVLCGLGGSGIGASLIDNILEGDIKIPIIVNKKYTLPAFADKNSLVVIASYSGNTEEAISAFDIALTNQCNIVVVCSGGILEQKCIENNIEFIKIPSGFPPRSYLGFALVQLFYVLYCLGFINDSFKSDFQKVIQLLDSEKENIKKDAKELANNLLGKTPIIYSADNFEAVSVRFRQQINENSKMLAWHHSIPELNHNELVGWRIENDKQAVVFFRNSSDYSRIQTRMDITKDVVSKYTPHVFEIWSKGDSMLEKALYLINLGDWVSLYLSYLRKVDTTEVNVIDYLKGELAK